jgi:hypothetical protein
MSQGLHDAHDGKFLGIGPALASGSKHLRTGNAFEDRVWYPVPDGRYQSRAQQVARRLASNQSDA